MAYDVREKVIFRVGVGIDLIESSDEQPFNLRATLTTSMF